jgi:hypothetical protein
VTAHHNGDAYADTNLILKDVSGLLAALLACGASIAL